MYATRYRRWKDRRRRFRETALLKKPVGHGRVFTYRDCVEYVKGLPSRRGEWSQSLFSVDSKVQVVEFDVDYEYECVAIGLYLNSLPAGIGVYELCIGDPDGEYCHLCDMECSVDRVRVLGMDQVPGHEGMEFTSFDGDVITSIGNSWSGTVVKVFLRKAGVIYQDGELQGGYQAVVFIKS